jgi:RNA polymerase II subunit A-like phosphatase
VPLSSTVTTLKERLAAKLASKKAEPCKSDEPEVAVKTTAMEKGKKQTFPIVSPASGLLRANKMNPKSMIDESQQKLYIGYIEECLHPTFLDGMCVVCGTPVGRQPDKSVVASAGVGHSAEMSSSSAIVNNRDTLSQVTVSGGVTMTVSERESRQMALLDAERLFGQKRLSLVLDLDHTLVHATSDARARQYLAQHNDVRSIRLPMLEGADPGVPVNPEHFNMYMHHYVKLRPNINEFFQGVQSLYEVTVYTAGTRQYAEEITMVLCRSLVGSSRDWEDLEHLRYQVFLAEEEYAKYSRMEDAQADNEQKKRKIEEAQEEDENGVVENSNEPPKKRKKVSFGFREVVDEKGMQKSDHITKEKLKSLQIELRKADDLEQKARELRQKIFGSRVFSRTELGDLGRDVKSLKRIFPCGGAMAAVVDDREDVWANAKDNNKSITKGEPPENLLLVRPYHWSPFVGFADVNNAAGADLSGSTPRKDSDPKNEKDNQLLWTKEILEKLHRRYFQQNEKGNRLTVPETLKEMRRNVLKGSTLVLSGLVPLHKQSTVANTPRPPIVRYAQSLGAKVSKIRGAF